MLHKMRKINKKDCKCKNYNFSIKTIYGCDRNVM